MKQIINSMAIVEIIDLIIQGIGEDASLIFYSSLFVGNAALVTLTAMFVIYKKQGFDFAFTRIERIIVDYLTSACKISINYGSIHELEIFREEMCKGLDDGIKYKLQEVTGSTQWKKRFEELKNLRNEYNIFISDAGRPMVIMFTLLLISVILLPFSGAIHHYLYLEFSLFVAVLLLQVVSLLTLFSFLKKRFRTS